jgi:hypothetical protein
MIFKQHIKKGIVVIILLITSTQQNAQVIPKGNIMTGILLNGNYSTTPFSDSVYTQTNYTWHAGANLGVGVFIKDNLLLVGKLDYSYSNTTNKMVYNQNIFSDNYTLITNTNAITPAILLSKYFFVTDKIAFSLGGGISSSYSRAVSTTTYYNPFSILNMFTTTSKQSTLAFQFNLLAGFYYFITKSVALTGNMAFFPFSYTDPQTKKGVQTRTLSFNNGNVFNNYGIGITYYFSPKKN